MTTAANAYPGTTRPEVKLGIPLELELSPEQADSYRDLLTGILDKYEGRRHDGWWQRKWTDDSGNTHATTTCNRRDLGWSGEGLLVHRDDATGEIRSTVESFDYKRREEEPSTWGDEVTFAQMGDGRTFLLHCWYGITPEERVEMVNKSQPELIELFNEHVKQVQAVEKRLSTPRARLARLGRRVMESILPDRHRIKL